MATYARACPRQDSCGLPCPFVLRSFNAFKRHMVFHHGINIIHNGRGPTATEVMVTLTREQWAFRRLQMSVRRGGQSQERQRLRDGVLAPAPPPPPAALISAMPPAYGAAMPSATLSAAPTVSTSLLHVDYRSEVETTSPLSSGGRTNDTQFDTEYTDENCTRQFVELAEVHAVFSAQPPQPTLPVRFSRPTVSAPPIRPEPVLVPPPTRRPTPTTSTAESTQQQTQPPRPKATAVTQCSVARQEAAVQATADTQSAACDARPLPRPTLSPPEIDTYELARRAARSIAALPLTSTDVLVDDVLRTLPPDTPASEVRAVTLAIDFGAELLRATADSVLAEVEARFGHLDDVDERVMLTFIFEVLDIWRRRPERPRLHDAANLL